MGNVAFTARQRAADTPIMVIIGHLKSARNIDLIAALCLGLIVGLVPSDGPVELALGWLAFSMTLIDSVILTFITSRSTLRGTTLAVANNAILVGVLVTRDILLVHFQESISIKLSLIIIFSLLVANKIALVIILRWYMNRMRGAAGDDSPYAALDGGDSKSSLNGVAQQGEFI
mmetsp:Transcript_31551/g.54403  ORF Transcript_31551/g.54403 Transcript_31551/m.54403 type:complete len:174 (-) Transcript_31551:150-671(-)